MKVHEFLRHYIKKKETIDPEWFKKTQFPDVNVLYEDKYVDIHPLVMKSTVVLLTYFMLSKDLETAFFLPLIGAKELKQIRWARKWLKRIKGLDDFSIAVACRLARFDVAITLDKRLYDCLGEYNPNEETVHNIRVMVKRTLKFFETFGQPKRIYVSFEGGYTKVINVGHSDFLVKTTLINLQYSDNDIKENDAMKLLLHYILSTQSEMKCNKAVRKIGLFNPKLNTLYHLDLKKEKRVDVEDLRRIINSLGKRDYEEEE